MEESSNASDSLTTFAVLYIQTYLSHQLVEKHFAFFGINAVHTFSLHGLVQFDKINTYN